MTDNKNNLYLFEAIELRNEYDRNIKLLEKLIEGIRLSRKVVDPAYKRIIYKEERDIVQEPKHSFRKTYADYTAILSKMRDLIF